MINPNSKKQIVQLEDDTYFKDLIESIKAYLIEYPKKKNFPVSVYKAAYGLVEYATIQFEENTKKVEELIRQREENKDYYYSFENEKFEETLKMNIKEQLKITNIPLELVNTLKITPIKAKKVIIKFYEKQIECSTGIFELEGNIELLNYLYKAGMGSKHSAGFGMFQIV